jgi:hypothetical protein
LYREGQHQWNDQNHSLPTVSVQDPYIVIVVAVVAAAISHQQAMKELMMMLMP